MEAAFQGKHHLDRSCVGRELVPHTINCQPDLPAGPHSPQVEVFLLGPAGLGQPDLVPRDRRSGGLGTSETPTCSQQPGQEPHPSTEWRAKMGQTEGISAGNAWGTPVGLVVTKCVYSQHLFVFSSQGGCLAPF